MKKISIMALCLMASVGLFAQVQVTADKSGTELQAAIDAAEAGTTVYVQAGTFYGNFTMKEGVNVSGGWNEGFTAQTDYATILDAQANGRVLEQPAAFTTLTVWSNLTIQNGKLTATATVKAGAGVVLCDKGQVKHCLIQNNLFDASSGEASGGGVYENGFTESVLVDDCIIRGNSASHGGGVRICGVMQNSIIENNTTSINACGGVQLHYGGAMYNCIVRNNTGKDTGGVRLTGTKPCTVANCLIAGNIAKGTIGGISLEQGVHYVYNNTIVGNNQSSSNPTRCGVRLNVNSDLVFANNIVWGNKANGEVQADQMEIHATYASDRAATYFLNNAVVHASVGTNTIVLTTADPGFTDAANGDYTLLETSSLVDAGNNAYAQGLEDLAGNARVAGATVDLGCYEFQPAIPVDRYVEAGEDLQEAINAATAGDTVFVVAGTFTGNFTMKEGVNVSGGWNADFTAQTDYATILDANNTGRVVTQTAAFATLTIWENLTIQNGNDANTSTGGGGAWLDRLGQLKHCLICNNTTTGYGGGVGHNVTAAATHGEVVVTDCIVRYNKSGKQGGGVRVGATVENSLVERNISGADGAGVYLQHGCVRNCVIRLNHSTGNAGGIRAYGHTEIYNNLIYANVANGQIGGISQGGASRNSNVVNNTIVCNKQISSTNPHRCGALLGDNAANATFINNIVWANYAGDAINETQTDIVASRMGSGSISNNAIYNAELGDKAIKLTDANPGFVELADADTTKWDLHLEFPSVLLDKGMNSAVPEGATDLDGLTRIQGSAVDLGVYELPYFTLTVAAFEHATLTVEGIGVLPAGAYPVPYGYTTTATIAVEEGYKLTSVKLGEEELIPVEGVYTIPALTEDAVVTIIVEEDEGTGLDQVSANVCRKVVRDGQVIIIRNGKDYNVLGF